MKLLLPALLAACALSAPSVSEAAPPRYRLQWLQDVPAPTIAGALNDAGDVAGAYYTGEFLAPPYLLRDGRLRLLPGLAETRATRLALNDRGDIAISTDGYDGPSAYVFRGGRARALRLPSGFDSPMAWDIDAAGRVLASGSDTDGAEHAFLFDGRGRRALDTGATPVGFRALNDRGLVVGGIQADSGVRPAAAVWRDGALSFLRPPGTEAGTYRQVTGIDVNNAGQVLIRAETDTWPDDATDTWLYGGGRYERIGSRAFEPAVLNERGWVLGNASPPPDRPGDGWPQAALWADGALHALDTLLRPADAAHWTLRRAFDLNDAGQILLQGLRKGTGEQGVLLATPVPEPAALALVLAGLGVVGAVARRRARPPGHVG
ncbi:PEP-CTERM sorting domain-containing protein [Azohydromonas aeria]|uniref:PEP-CTERM sorting domain-containing protein n=1 Tax=Azohydromonas aeria TaxID=2590212 RepID=UPI0018DEFB84|nr:PEP-CTERM sorting domain-containing protein [Azohydromonas aeria]